MNGIEKIIDKITSDGKSEAEAIIRNAEAEAVACLESAYREADEKAKEIISAAKLECDELIRRSVGMAELESRKMTLAAKQELIDSAFERALLKISSLRSVDYLSFLTELAKEAGSEGELIFSPSDRAKYGKDVVIAVNKCGANLTLSVETRPIKGGLILKNGKVETNCDISALIRLSHDSLAKAVAEKLF